MDFLEKDLEDIIFNSIKTQTGLKILNERGLCVEKPTLMWRQLRIGNYGTADIVLFNKEYRVIDVFELKKGIIDLDALKQIIRYKKGIQQYLKYRKSMYCEIRINIIGKNVETESCVLYLFDEVDNLNIYTYKYNIDGISFESDRLGYQLIDEGFDNA